MFELNGVNFGLVQRQLVAARTSTEAVCENLPKLGDVALERC